ncbi:MAG: adenine phosphoribosyltransferase [Patescibacteria group bacterium]|nr:adenine phosphoribosyltransferase [Patescibacteria group bacterium]
MGPLLADKHAFEHTIDQMAEKLHRSDFSHIVAMDARGFLFGSALAYKLNKGIVMVRKKGKLPGQCISKKFEYEYAGAEFEIQKNQLHPGEKVVVIDDVLATGNSVATTIDLLKELDINIISAGFLIELEFLNGKEKLGEIPYFSLVQY